MDAFYMGIDQFDNTYHTLKWPRKELMERLGYKSARKMYRDPNNRHVGWVIGPYWIEVFRVLPLNSTNGKEG
jgi:hypothetical protein